MRAVALAALALAGAAALAACDSLPGRPSPEDRPVVPTEVKDFARLYADTCSGCHGADGTLGAGTPLRNPVYLALADDQTIRAAIVRGIPGTAMPAFAASEGGMLADDQIEILVGEIRKRWSDPAKVSGTPLPPYSAAARSAGAPLGDAARGSTAYGAYCASCHGAKGTGGPRGGSIVDPSYLALVSDQGLRTAVIAGRPDLGMPDWRGYAPGRPMSSQEISDVVAWLVAHR